MPASLSRADNARAEVRLGAGADVVHKQGRLMASASAGPLSFLIWDSDNYGPALSYNFGPRVGWNAGIGLLVARRTDDDVGTHPNALLRGSYCGEKLCLSYAHISHGASLGIGKGEANSGLNFVYLEYRLR